MIRNIKTDAVVLGGGPAGLSAAITLSNLNIKPLVIEREERLGGILKQCIHDGFGILKYGERLAGPEYSWRFINEASKLAIDTELETFVCSIKKNITNGFSLECTSKKKGAFTISCKSIVLATGCREKTDRQIFIHGDRPSGIFTAGLAQYLVNIKGLMPGKKCIVLGSGDIGLIMARRLLLEGAMVEGVFELKKEPSGLARNVSQCLEDYGIPLFLSTTVKEIHGSRRIESVIIVDVDIQGNIIPGTERELGCDSLILSVGLIPENEVASFLNINIDPMTGGPFVNQYFETSEPGIFACGNSLFVHDLVDYVTESGEIAGKASANFILSKSKHKKQIQLQRGSNIQSVIPQFIDLLSQEPVVLGFRSRTTIKKDLFVKLNAFISSQPESKENETCIFKKRYMAIRSSEMEHIVIEMNLIPKNSTSLKLSIEYLE